MKKKSWFALSLGSMLLLGLMVFPASKWLRHTNEARAGMDHYKFLDLFYIKNVIYLVNKNYVERKKIKPEKMFFKALKSIQLTVPSILIRAAKDKKSVKVHVGNKKQSFILKKFKIIDDVPYQLRQIFRFIRKSYKGDVKMRDIEFAALKGILSTLDPHTTFLPPSYYKEMRIHTGGKFGGLGIVIQNRKGRLTIVSPMPDTPAARVGLKPLDKIVRIGDESTINMSLNDAVTRLRGRAGTKVVIWIMRKGYIKPKPFTITRAIIKVKSVTNDLLSGKIGYIRIKSFQSETSQEVRRALWKMRKQSGGIKGLILDLRDNPGGLLDQAVEVSDTFLPKGEIVTHQGISSLYKVHRAQELHTQPNYPIVVLVNQGSASASEIVAGALKNNQRAIVLGQQTFGKGTVQILYPIWHRWAMFNRERSALKLTVAQYLTPGGISIQDIGITPDIALHPVHIEKGTIQIFREDEDRRKKNGKLPKFLKATKEFRKPLFHLSYFDTTTEKERLKRAENEYSKKKKKFTDFEILFAKNLLKQAKKYKRKAFYRSARSFLIKSKKQQRKRIFKELKKYGVNWRLPPKKVRQPKLSVQYKILPSKKSKKGQLWAGKTFKVRVSIKNSSTFAAHRVRAITQSAYWFFNRKEFVFGHIPAGKTKSWTAQFKIPKWLKPQVHMMNLNIYTDASKKPQKSKIHLNCHGHKQPRFAFSFAVEERKGNKDQLLQAGEEVALRITVKNLGPGTSKKTAALLRNKTGRELFIERGRIVLGALKPGQQSTSWFHFKVHRKTQRKYLEMELNIYDSELLTNVREQVSVRVYPKALALKPMKLKNQWLRVNERLPWIYSGASLDTPKIAKVSKSTVLRAIGRLGPFYQVILPKSLLGKRFHNKRRPKKKYSWVGWIAAHEVKVTKKKRRTKKTQFKFHWRYVTPDIQISSKHAPTWHNQQDYTLKGILKNNVALRDMYILLNDEKVYYKSLRNTPKMKFNVPLKLKKGKNRILIVARESEGFSGFREFFIFRKDTKKIKTK